MRDARAFLAVRQPGPPAGLEAWLESAAIEGATPLDGLTRAGLEALDRARGAPGRLRESAFHLLAADALLTYACEAALELPDVAGALSDLVLRTAAAR